MIHATECILQNAAFFSENKRRQTSPLFTVADRNRKYLPEQLGDQPHHSHAAEVAPNKPSQTIERVLTIIEKTGELARNQIVTPLVVC